MRIRSYSLCLFVSALLGGLTPCVRARSQMAEVEVRGKRKISASHAMDPTASGTELDLRDRVTLPRSLGDVVREAPGAQVQSTGAMGAFTTLSLRGAAAEETWVLIDEIPLSSMDGGAFDLSLLPAELFQTVNVFRGGAPVWLGSGAIGGVMQLVPHRAKRNQTRISAGGGSFGTYQLDSGIELWVPRGISSHSQVVVRGTRGDFPYLDDRGTRWVDGDDRTFRIRNGDFFEGSGIHDTRIELRRGSLHLLALGVSRGGGFPGSPKNPARQIRRESTRAQVGASYTVEGGDELSCRRRLSIVAAGAYGADRFRDPQGEQGTSRMSNTENRNFRGFLRSAGSLAFTRWLEGTLVGSYSFDRYLPHDEYVFPLPSDSDRHALSGALELALRGSLGPVRLELRPSGRLEWTRSEIYGRMRNEPEERRQSTLLSPTSRIGLVIEPLRGLAVSASAATGYRAPTFVELFGDGGLLILPNWELEPVRSQSYDAGLSARGRLGVVRGRAELRGFVQERSDAIIAERTNQQQLIYRNVASLSQRGIEASLNGWLTRYFRLSGSFTALEAELGSGKRQPLRPKYVAAARPEIRVDFGERVISSASASSELWHRSFAFYDNANLGYSGSCTKLAFSAGLGVFSDRLRLTARMDDALDQRCADVLNYPLPGRSLFLSLTYTGVEDET